MSFTKDMNMATGQLDRALYNAHTAWLKAGDKGAGRLVIKGEILRRLKAAAHERSGARFESIAETNALSDSRPWRHNI
jgi:hypothetical protein